MHFPIERTTKTFSLLLLVFSISSIHASDQIKWQSDYDKAYQQAKDQNKLLVVFVHTSWCPPCRMMESQTYRSQALISSLNENCIALNVDGDRNQSLQRRLGVHSFPTHVIISPDGKIVDRKVGFMNASEYLKKLDRSIQIAKIQPKTKPNTAFASAQEQVKPENGKSTIALKSDQENKSAQNMPLGLGGYCPVSMVKDAVLVSGNEEFEITFDDKRFLFKSDEHRKLFLSNPEKYLPGADGICVVAEKEDGVIVVGKIKLPAIFKDRVYFFSSEEHRQAFLKDPEKFIK